MKKETLENELQEATTSLLEMAKASCWNNISSNVLYIISEIKSDFSNAFDEQKRRNIENDKKNPKPLKQLVEDLKCIYENSYDVNLYVYKSEKKNTIIEIRYYPKSSLDSDFYKTVKNENPMLHIKIAIPPYHKKRKYDINWELGGIRHELNFFWYKLMFNQKYKKNKK